MLNDILILHAAHKLIDTEILRSNASKRKKNILRIIIKYSVHLVIRYLL